MKANYDFSKGIKNPYVGRIKAPPKMGRIIASVTIDNVVDKSKSIRCDALVDTGASFMVLPMAWRDRLGNLETMTEVEMETPTQAIKMKKNYDFSKGVKNPYAKRLKRQLTIRLDHDTIEYFQKMSDELSIPYQTLINMYLRECAVTGKRLRLHWKPENRKRAA